MKLYLKKRDLFPITLSVSEFFVKKRRNVSNGLKGYIISTPSLLRYIFAYAKTLRTIGFHISLNSSSC